MERGWQSAVVDVLGDDRGGGVDEEARGKKRDVWGGVGMNGGL